MKYIVCSSHVTCITWKWHCYLDLFKLHILLGYCMYAVHICICTLYTHRLYWLIHDNCIVDTLNDAYFPCYRLAHEDGKCTNCMLQLLHWIYIDYFRFQFRFSFLPSCLQIWDSIRVHISLEFVVLIICRPLQIAGASSSWTVTHMPVVVKTCSFITATLVSED